MFSVGTPRTTSLTAKVELQVNSASVERTDPQVMADLLSVSVTEDVDVVGMFEITLVNWDLVSGKFTWVDDRLFDIGNEVQIAMSYSDRPGKLITGEITGLEPAFDQQEVSILVVRGHDLRHRLMRGQKTRTFTKMKDSAIAQQIAQQVGLRAKVTDSKVQMEYVLQQNQTDLDFLQSRAQRIGYEVAIEDKTLYFQPPRNDGSKVLTLTYEEDLLSFTPRLSTMNQTSHVEVRGWDMKKKQEMVGKAQPAQVSSIMGGKSSGPKASQKAFGKASQVVVTAPVFTKAEADQIAQGQLDVMALGYVTGEGSCRGNPQVRAGKVLEIKGVGKRFSGLYYVTSATHTYEHEGGYYTTFEVRRTAT